MKFYKIFACGLLALALSACSDDDKSSFNTAPNVTVNMQQSSIEVTKKFTGVYYNVPIVVTGEANGPIEVTVEANGVSSNPATEGEDFSITQKTIIIPADKQIGYIQFYPIGSDDETSNKAILFTIKSAKGASIGNLATAEVTLTVPTTYEKLQGAWTFNYDDEGPASFALTCTGVQKGNTGYGVELYFAGFQNYNWVSIMGNLTTNEATGDMTVSFPLGQVVAEDVNFGSTGIVDVGLGSVNGGYLVASGDITAEITPDLKNIVFDPSDAFLGCLMDNGQLTTRIWFWYEQMEMIR